MRSPHLFQLLLEITPQGNNFDPPDSTYAQDAVAVLDAALRALTSTEPLCGDSIWYVVEPIKMAATHEQSGGESLTVEGPDAVDWENRLMANPIVAAYLKDCEDLIARLESAGDALDINALRTEARSKAVSAKGYMSP